MARKPDIQYIRFYTDGSTARQPEPRVPKRKPLPRPRVQKRTVTLVHIDPLAVLGIVIAAVMLVLMAVGAFRLEKARERQSGMALYVDSLEEQNERLEEKYRAGYDLDTVEDAALALGMVPAEQIRQVSIQVAQPEEPQTLDFWQQIGEFFRNLFA